MTFKSNCGPSISMFLPVNGFHDERFGGVLILKLLHYIINVMIQLKQKSKIHQSATFTSHLLHIIIRLTRTNTVNNLKLKSKIKCYTKSD